MKNLLQYAKQLSPNCREATWFYSRSLDGAVPLSARLGTRIHLLLCKRCRRYSRQTLFLRAACRRIQNSRPPKPHFAMPAEMRSSLQARLRQEMEKM